MHAGPPGMVPTSLGSVTGLLSDARREATETVWRWRYRHVELLVEADLREYDWHTVAGREELPLQVVGTNRWVSTRR